MFNNYLSSIKGVAIFPIISLIVFFALSVGVTIWVLRMKSDYIKEMEELPLDTTTEIKNEETHNAQK